MEVSEIRLGIVIVAIFTLGIAFSIVNGLYTESTGAPIPVIAYGMSASSMIVGAMVVLLFQHRISQRQMDNLLKILPYEERRIMEVLIKEGKIEQNYLVAETGLSKVTVSRRLAALQQRGILEKRPLGNTNLIKLRI
jgi:uncharacterized membrane protein